MKSSTPPPSLTRFAMAAAALPGPSPGFRARKREILDRLAVPTADYTDASPKGSVDEGIRHLIAEINGREGLVTTSSCAGRVSVFLEGRKKAPVAARAGSLSAGAKPDDEDEEEAEDEGEPARSTARLASAGGKGGGGSWLFVSHDPIDVSAQSLDDASSRWEALFGLGQSADGAGLGDLGVGDSERLIHFKFEPMVCERISEVLLPRYLTLLNAYCAYHSRRYCTSWRRPTSTPSWSFGVHWKQASGRVVPWAYSKRGRQTQRLLRPWSLFGQWGCCSNPW